MGERIDVFEIDVFTILCHDDAVPYDLITDTMRQGIERGYRIHVLNYYGNSEHAKFPERITESMIWREAERLADAEIDNMIGTLTGQDILYVFGAERLVPNIGKKAAVEIDFIEKTSRFHYEEQEDWKPFCEKLDHWYGRAVKCLGGLITCMKISAETEKIIVSCLETSDNMSISSLRYGGNGCVIQRELYDAIAGRKYTLSQMNRMIEDKKSILGESVCRYMRAVACKVTGKLQSAIDILQEADTKELEANAKLLLANCYYMDGRGQEALELLEDLYREDPYVRGLADTLIRASYGTEREEEWIETLYQRFPGDMGVMEAYGSLKCRNGENKTAAQIFRKISALRTGYYKYYYELTARMNDIIDEHVESEELVWQYLYSIIDREPRLNNEAVWRAANYFKNMAGDAATALRLMDHAHMSADEPLTEELVILKMELLKEVKGAGTGLGNAAYLHKRCMALLEAMAILCCSGDTGYSRWRDYMASMSAGEWREALYLELLNMIHRFSEIDYEEAIRNFNLSDENELLRALVINDGYVEGRYLSEEELNDLIRAVKIRAKVKGDSVDMPWGDYYGSLILAYRANFQGANNYALSLFQGAKMYQDREVRRLSGYLGLLAWGNSQFRQNRKEEGIACIIAGFLMAEKTKIYTPYLENAIPVLALFLIKEYDAGRSGEKKAVEEFAKTFSKYSPFVEDYFGNQEPLTMIRKELQELESINGDGEAKMYSALRIVNCIGKLVRDDPVKAAEIVRRYGDVILDAIKDRKDSVDRVCIIFAQLLTGAGGGISDTEQIYKYFSRAVRYIEEKRRVFHQEERTAVSQDAGMVYRQYMEFLAVQAALKRNRLPDGKRVEDELLFCAQRILPRTLEEQNIYNNECQITEDEKEQFRQYIELQNQYYVQKRNSREEDEALLETERELEKQINGLKENHPYFQPLSQLETYSTEQIQNRLRTGEVLIHCVVLEKILMIIMISGEKHGFFIKGTNHITEQFALYAEMWKAGNNQDKCRELSDQITNCYFDVVYEFIKANQLKRAFIISDFAMGTYSLTGSRCKNEYLTDIVESIVHITNYNVLWRKTQRFPPDEIYNRIYGDPSDSALQQIESWLCGMCNQHKNMHFINGDDNFSLPENERNAYIVYGHGVHGDKQRDAADGAVGIWCDNHILTVKDILKNLETQNIDFFILMSCSGGMPVGQDPERDQGSWVHMIERLRGGIISCHWDVKVEAVCCFLAILLKGLNDKEGMDTVFLKAVRAMRQDFNDLEDWAGFEYWEN